MAQKVWQFVPNYVPTNGSAANLCANVLWFWTRILLGDQTALSWVDSSNVAIGGGSVTGKWFVWGSCDGSGAGSFSNGGTSGSPATDKWTSTFTASKIVQATAGSNHSWFVLGSPASFGGSGVGPFYIIIDCNSATTTQVSVYLCKTAPTVNGTATARPTSTDEVPLNTNPATFLVTTTLTHHLQGMLTTDGIMRVFQSRDGLASFASNFAVEAFADAPAGDLWPVALHLYHQDTPGVSTWCYGIRSECWDYAALNPRNTNSVWRGRSADGTVITSFVPFVKTFYNANTDSAAGGFGQVSVAASYAANPNTLKWDNLPDWGMIGVTNQYPGYRGRLYDVGLAPARKGVNPVSLSDGVLDSTGKYMVVGDSWQPCPVGPVM